MDAPNRTARLSLWLIILLAAVALTFGGLWWREQALVEAYRNESDCNRVLRAEGAAYNDVSVHVTSHPKAVVLGEVASQADRDRLVNRLAEELGAERRARVLVNVRVR
jgi:hypothetical protein